MANEVLYAGIADLTTVEALSSRFLLLAADRNALPAHPAILKGYMRDMAGAGSQVLKVPHVGIYGYDKLQTGAEGVDTGNTALSDGSSTLSVVQKDKVYEYSDLVRMLDSTGIIRPDVFAVDAVASASVTMRDMLANLVDNFSSTVGATGVNATLANWIDAITTLTIAAAEGDYLGVLHPVQAGDIMKDAALASGGAVQFNPGVQALLEKMMSLGYKGRLLGVDMFTTLSVPTANAGADRAGGMFGAGAIIWADGTIPVDTSDSNQMVLADKVLFERIRNGRGGTTGYLSRKYIGMSEGLDAFGCSIITDA